MQRKNTYEGQALAIAMIIVVVSAIVAMSAYVRTMKDKNLTFEERASVEALEVSDLIINKIASYSLGDVVNAISIVKGEPFSYEEGTNPPLKENSEKNDISRLFLELGITDSIRELSICPLNQSGNEYSLTLKQAEPNTYYEIQPGQSWSFPIKGELFPEEAQLYISFDVRGDSKAGFTIYKSYASNYTEGSSIAQTYKEYDYEDITNYCFSDDSATCNGQDERFLDDNWVKYDITNKEQIPVSLAEVKDGHKLDEVRVTAIGGTIGLLYIVEPEEYLEGFRLLQLRATANCYNIYRGKEVLIPEKKWHNSMFDYVLFNTQGSM